MWKRAEILLLSFFREIKYSQLKNYNTWLSNFQIQFFLKFLENELLNKRNSIFYTFPELFFPSIIYFYPMKIANCTRKFFPLTFKIKEKNYSNIIYIYIFILSNFNRTSAHNSRIEENGIRISTAWDRRWIYDDNRDRSFIIG